MYKTTILLRELIDKISTRQAFKQSAIMMTGSRTLSSASKGGTSQPAKSINKGMGEYEKAIIFSYSHAFFIVINSS